MARKTTTRRPPSEWTVRKASHLLQPGEKFIFAEDLGGEGEVLTVVSTEDSYGIIAITTDEVDFEVELTAKTWVTMA